MIIKECHLTKNRAQVITAGCLGLQNTEEHVHQIIDDKCHVHPIVEECRVHQITADPWSDADHPARWIEWIAAEHQNVTQGRRVV